MFHMQWTRCTSHIAELSVLHRRYYYGVHRFTLNYSTMTKISVVDSCDKPLGCYHDHCCRIGDAALRHILTKASLFVAVGSGGNYVQITGWYNISGLGINELWYNLVWFLQESQYTT